MLTIRRATPRDLAAVMAIERTSFAAPWSTAAIREELGREEAVYLVAEEAGRTVGYGGMWLAADEAHVGTLAVEPAGRRRGIGMALMLALLERARMAGVHFMHLEYRVSNEAAAALYARLGFRPTRVRKRYYADNGEDAVEVVLDDLGTTDRGMHLAELRRQWELRYGERHAVGG